MDSWENPHAIECNTFFRQAYVFWNFFPNLRPFHIFFLLSQIAPECTTIKGMRLQTELFVFIKTFQIGSSEWCSNTHQNIFMANKHNSILNIYKSMGLHCKLENWVMLVHVFGGRGTIDFTFYCRQGDQLVSTSTFCVQSIIAEKVINKQNVYTQ